ncbi:MAG: DNA mismatch repair endonuclease MutL, partial [Ignavibacteria bacterium]|nr:DNA mismatch repair endonuclease MutL [Ignavibacteria bacterium]
MSTASRIRILPPELANKIAAGEVVQRPASIVKELVENSLDAGASRIVIVVRDGGRGEITISDNGVGMSPEEVRLSVRRHATSKIATLDDLEGIETYGFRGEALASIAAVSKLVIKSRRPEDAAATVLTMHGEGESAVTLEGREPGTIVSVQNLFFNVPARRKFLRSRTTEFRHIHEAVQRVALARPEIAVELLNDGKRVFNLRSQTLHERVVDLFGDHAASGLIFVHENGEPGVEGYIGKPAFSRQGRSQQLLYVNKRPIVNRSINHAVFSAYEHLMIKGAYPFFILFLTMDPRLVDVNVHPSKSEARFQDEGALYKFVHSLVRKSVSSAGLVPAVSFTGSAPQEDATLRFTSRQHLWPAGSGSLVKADRDPERPGRDETFSFPKEAEEGESRAYPKAGMLTVSLSGPVLQIHRKYILLQVENGLMMVDQHVAHERVLYERIVERLSKGTSEGQQLLFPRTFTVNHADRLLLDELTPYLTELGFTIKPFGGDTMIVESAPAEAEEG